MTPDCASLHPGYKYPLDSAGGRTMADAFPGVGHKYLVDFATADGTRHFKVQLDFRSATSLTYTGVRADGSLSDHSETVDITVEPIRDMLFLVTWKEEFGT